MINQKHLAALTDSEGKKNSKKKIEINPTMQLSTEIKRSNFSCGWAEELGRFTRTREREKHL